MGLSLQASCQCVTHRGDVRPCAQQGFDRATTLIGISFAPFRFPLVANPVNAALRYLAISVLLLYTWYVASGSLLHIGLSQAAISLRVNLVNPITWVIVIVSMLTAWGLGKRFAWAWWLGLVGALVQLGRVAWWVVQRHSLAHLPDTGVWLVVAMLAVFITLLLTPPVRRACTR